MISCSTAPVRGALLCALACLSLACAGKTEPTTTTEPGAPGPTSASDPADFPAQVALGQTLYGEHCASCHGASGEGGRGPRVVGLAEGALPLEPPADRKVRKTRFVTVADVATFAVENMPPGNAGKLTTEQYLAILAFDLKANGIDLGQDKLTLEKAAELTIPR
jgi:mono/diheme cytochrome c family protein